MAERLEITNELCEHVKILLKGGATMGQAGKIAGISQATVSRIKAAGFDAEVYRQNVEKRRKNNETVRTVFGKIPKEKLEYFAERTMKTMEQINKEEEQVPGQIEMELLPPKEPIIYEALRRMEKAVYSSGEKTAAKICELLGKINDNLCQILRKMDG